MALFPWLAKALGGGKKKTFPCEPSTNLEIINAMTDTALGRTDGGLRLKQMTCRISEDQIPWADLRCFGFLGAGDWQSGHVLEENGFDPGIYIDRDGTALILIHRDDALIQPWVDRCAGRLQILAVYYSAIYELDVSSLVNLQAILMYQTEDLSSLTGLEKTKQLTVLRLYGCRRLTALPGLETLAQLTSLTLYECRWLTALPSLEKLVQLTSLELSGYSWLTALPGLENLVRLNELCLYDCACLTALPGLENLVRLNELCLYDCACLAALPGLENLGQLTRLRLSGCSQLTALPGLEKLVHLTRLDIRRCAQLTALPGLENLVRLNELHLYDCACLAALPGLETLVQLTNLDLSYCSQLTALPGLENLVQLEKLDLQGCTQLTALPGLEKLVHLTSLYLSRCSQLTALPGLEKLVHLTSLILFECSQLTALPGLEKLVHLTNLSLSGCSQLMALPGLEKLVHLTSLSLSGCFQFTSFPGLENLVQLTRLDLSECARLTSLPGLEKLVRLTNLDLHGCTQLAALPGLEKLVQLEELDLHGCTQLTALPGLERLAQLFKLDLSGCTRLTALAGLEHMERLLRLNLSGCTQLTALPEGIRQRHMIELWLQHMQLKSLPDWLPEIAGGFTLRKADRSGLSWVDLGGKAAVYLHGTTVEGVDMSIFEQPYEVVAEWFRNRSTGDVRPLNEIKVVFLGDGEAGKSHTIARLMNDGGEPDYAVFDGQSTPGIVIRNKEYELKDYDLGDRKFTVHYWDFGGQEIMHSMHRIFLTGRTMYVILLNARDDTQSDRAKYWLHNVRSFAPEAPVLLVLNKIDQNPNASVDEKDLRGRYDRLTQVVRLSAKDFTREQFNGSFTKVLLEEIQKTGYLDAQWPNIWTKVKEQLEHMTSHYIMGDAYQKICDECRVERNRKELLHWFNDLGISFCYCDDYKLEDYVILRPDWITNALYIILFNTLEGASNGLIPHRSIYDLLKKACNNPAIRCTLPQASYTSNDIGYVLGIMRKFSLSFTDGHENEFIPMLCQQNSMADIQYYQKDAQILEFQMKFDYLPNNLLHRLMVERYTELDMTTVWRTGARFELKEPGYSALVVIDGNTLCFFIRHSDPMHRPNTYLTMLKAHVDRIVAHMGLKAPTCKLIYKLPDGRRAEFGYDRILKLHTRGRREEYCEALDMDLPIEDILNQSAPDDLADERKLLDQIIRACGNIQDEPGYRLIPNPDGRGYANGKGMEDLRNRRVRDNLLNAGYRIFDQTQRGLSGSGKSVGELDLLVCNEANQPWTVIEALRVSGKDKSDWNAHLKKLTENYNTRGFPALYLLTYVDAEPAAFAKICTGYREHIKRHHPGTLSYLDGSFTELNITRSQYIKVIRCRYSGGGDPIAVYHIFVQIPTQNR